MTALKLGHGGGPGRPATQVLDFDGAGYTVQDHIYGRMRQGFRMDLAQPYSLLSASEHGEPLLVTAAARVTVALYSVASMLRRDRVRAYLLISRLPRGQRPPLWRLVQSRTITGILTYSLRHQRSIVLL